MFKNPEFYLDFRRKVVPLLKTYPSARIWDAGCSSADEIYSIAIVLHEEGLDSKCHIYATQENEKLIKKMEQGVLLKSSLKRHEERYRKAGGKGNFREYFTIRGNHAVLKKEVRDSVSFFQHDLKTDSSFNEFQAILCRGALSHLDRSFIERAHQLFLDSLCTFGVLGLENGETIDGSSVAKHYQPIDGVARLFKKVA